MTSPAETRENRRYAREIKFVVPPDRAAMLREFVRSRMEPDSHGAGPFGDIYSIASLYFDTPEFDVYRRNGSFGRAKYRIRRYGASEGVFLERKLRSKKMLTKRRSAVALTDLARLDAAHADPDWAGYWFHRRLLARGLASVAQVRYTRTARILYNEFGVVRFTIDEDLWAAPADGFRFQSPGPWRPMTGENAIVEMKYCQHLPAALKEAIEKFELDPAAVSKYRLGAAAAGCIGEAPAEEPEGAVYA